jgi:hypothetical protein
MISEKSSTLSFNPQPTARNLIKPPTILRLGQKAEVRTPGVSLFTSGCKQLAMENVTSRQLVTKKQKNENDFRAPSPPKSATLEQRLPFEYIGLTVQAARLLAQQQGRQFRIGREDGEAYPITANACDGRITACVNDGIVSSIFVE